MPNIFQGKPTASEGRFAVVVARFNESITSRLLDGAVKTLVEHGVDDGRIDVYWVPGAFEIPTVARLLAEKGYHEAIICLGAVIRGETTHDRHINRAVSTALCELGVRFNLPVLFGLLTCDTIEQAIARSGGDASSTDKSRSNARSGNKGVDCALAALEMADLMTQLKPFEF